MIVSVEDGKYTAVVDSTTGAAKVLRYGSEWRDITGDKFILSLCDEIIELRQQVRTLSPPATTLKEMAALLDEVGTMLAESWGHDLEKLSGFRYPMADELHGYAGILGDLIDKQEQDSER